MAVKVQASRGFAAMNITPLIDVVFLLLIFYVVAAEITEAERETRQLSVTLPEASEALPVMAQPRDIEVFVDRRGQYFVGDRQFSADELLAELRQAAANNPGRQKVVISADRQCVFQPVVTVMDVCNKAQIRDYVVKTATPEGS